MKKKVLFDISVLGYGFVDERARTGVYRVCEESLKTLLSDDNIIVYPYASQGNVEPCINYLAQNFPGMQNNFVRIKQRKTLSLLRRTIRKKYDYCFSPYFEIPKEFRMNIWAKKVLIIYDLIQVKFPEWVRPEDTKCYQKLLNSIKNNTTTLCISDYTKKDFLEYKPNVHDVRVVPLGCDNRYNMHLDKKKIEQVREKYNIPHKKYFFSISSMNPRKNFRHIVKCFIDFIDKYNMDDVALVLSGPVGWGDLFQGIDFEKYKDKIIFTGFAAEEDLPYLYAGAIASAYMSSYEGFGLPPLESLACGTPVIASNCTSIPEVVGDAGILLDPKDENALTETYHQLATDDKIKKNLLKKAKPVLEKYTWNNFSQEVLKVFK